MSEACWLGGEQPDLIGRARRHAANWGCGSREGIADMIAAFATQELEAARREIEALRASQNGPAILRERIRVLEDELRSVGKAYERLVDRGEAIRLNEQAVAQKQEG